MMWNGMFLDRYATQTQSQIVEGLKEKYKVASIFKAIERLERLGRQGCLLSPIDGTMRQTVINRKPRLLVPFHFTKEKNILGLRNKPKSLPIFDALNTVC